MTNTLHRFGDAASFYDDYVIFAIPSRGKNDKGSLPKLKQFLEMALPFRPVNLGDAINGGDRRRGDGAAEQWASAQTVLQVLRSECQQISARPSERNASWMSARLS